MRRFVFAFFTVCLALFGPGGLRATGTGKPVVVVTTSLLAAAVSEVAGDAVEVETLLPPGTCPSYFDLEPGQVRRAAGAVLFLRHDFQPFLDAKLAAIGVDANRRGVLELGGANCIPANYARLCGGVAAALALRLPAAAPGFRARATEVTRRATEIEPRLRERVAPLRGRAVLVALRQVGFVKWLGLDVAAEFPATEDPPAAAIATAVDAARAAHVVAVIGNVPNGRRTPETLAAARKVPVVMFENFPSSNAPGGYWAMVDANLAALRTAVPH